MLPSDMDARLDHVIARTSVSSPMIRSSRLVFSKPTLDILDAYLAWEARRLNKTVGGLESAEYHCRVRIASFPLVDLRKFFSDPRIMVDKSV